LKPLFKFAGLAGMVALLYWGANSLKRAFTVRVKAYGLPHLSNFVLQVPITFEFNNPTPIGLKVDRLIADFYILKAGVYQPVGRVDQPVTLPAGTSEQILSPALDLRKLIGGDVIATVNEILQNKSLQLRIDVTALYGGILLPKQTYHETVRI
jgi:hypothetical protein